MAILTRKTFFPARSGIEGRPQQESIRVSGGWLSLGSQEEAPANPHVKIEGKRGSLPVVRPETTSPAGCTVRGSSTLPSSPDPLRLRLSRKTCTFGKASLYVMRRSVQQPQQHVPCARTSRHSRACHKLSSRRPRWRGSGISWPSPIVLRLWPGSVDWDPGRRSAICASQTSLPTTLDPTSVLTNDHPTSVLTNDHEHQENA